MINKKLILRNDASSFGLLPEGAWPLSNWYEQKNFSIVRVASGISKF